METVAWVQTVVLLITAVILYLYTAETAALRRESVHQTKISLRPVVVPIFSPSSLTSWRLSLKNIGSGSAFNIRISPLVMEGGFEFGYSFGRIDYLCPQEEKEILISQTIGGEIHYSDLTKYAFFPRFTTSKQELLILFHDVENGAYQIPVFIGPSPSPGREDGEVVLGPVGDSTRHTKSSLKRLIGRLFEWYP